MNKLLDTDEQIEKITQGMRLANEAAQADDITRRLGAFVLYAGIVDFFVIQAARLVEQIMLKSQLADGKQPGFQPHDDSYFYNRKVSTGRILKGIRKLLPFKSPDPSGVEKANYVTALANRMIDRGFDFLNYRNPIVHQIGKSSRTFDELINLCDKANAAYHKFREAHTAFFEAAGPYRFSEAELQYFYR